MPSNAIKGLGTGFRKKTWAAPLPGVWVVVGTVVSGVPRVSAPQAPFIENGILKGARGTYRITNITQATTGEFPLVPPAALSEFGDPADEMTVEYLSFSSEGPAITLPVTVQIMVVAVGTLSRSVGTVTHTAATWDTGGITVTAQKVINGVATSFTPGTTFTVNVGDTYYVTETASKSGFVSSTPAVTTTGTRPIPGITLVGSKVVTWQGTLSDQTVTLSGLTGGSNSSPSEGDLVVVAYSSGSLAVRTLSIITSGYTSLANLRANDTTDTNLVAGYKRMESTPDSSITVSQTFDIGDSGGVTIFVLRGVDATTPLSVAAVTKTGTNTGQPTLDPITPVDTGSLIVMMAASGGNPGAIFTSGLSNFITATRSDSKWVTVGAGTALWTGGTYTPVTWGGNYTDTTFSYAGVTLAFKPAA
jgi:hypothetical protein